LHCTHEAISVGGRVRLYPRAAAAKTSYTEVAPNEDTLGEDGSAYEEESAGDGTTDYGSSAESEKDKDSQPPWRPTPTTALSVPAMQSMRPKRKATGACFLILYYK